MILISRVFVLTLCFAGTLVYSQVTKPNSDKHPIERNIGQYLLYADQEGYSLKRGNEVREQKNLKGVKSFTGSQNGKRALLINYPFSAAKENYTITFTAFDSETGILSSETTTGYYDMPHPLFTINNNGAVAYCDPGALWIEMRNTGINKRIELIPGSKYEMERGVFILSDENRVYIAGNLNPVTTELGKDNTFIATVDIATGEVVSIRLPFVNLTSFGFDGNNLSAAGYTFNPGFTEGTETYSKSLAIIR